MSNPKYQSLKVTDSSEEVGETGNENMSQIVSTIPSTHSSQHLMSPDAESVITEEDQKSLRRRSEVELSFNSVTSSQWFTVAVLCFINLINYMDRFTIAGKCCTLRMHIVWFFSFIPFLSTTYLLTYLPILLPITYLTYILTSQFKDIALQQTNAYFTNEQPNWLFFFLAQLPEKFMQK